MSTELNPEYIFDNPYHVLKFLPQDREARRCAEREINYVQNELFQIEGSFLASVFNTDEPYDISYRKHLERFNSAVQRMKRVKKLKCIDIKERYFEELYQPVV